MAEPTLHGQDGSFDGRIATPALAEGRMFGLGPRGQLFALEAATGREVWRVDLVAREGAVQPFYGFSASPLVMLNTDEDLLMKQVKSATEAALRVYLDWGRYDRRGTREAWDMRMANTRFAAFLRERGYHPAGGEVPEGAGWGG